MEPQILLDNLCFGEGPRWRNGALWLADMYDRKVLRVQTDGSHATIVQLADDEPSGLGWLPDGDLLIVSMRKRQLLRFNGRQLTVHADLGNLATGYCNDMVVDQSGRAYVGNFGFDLHNGAEPAPAQLIRVEADGTAAVEDDDLMFPNGAVITPDGSSLIVAETLAGRLTAYDVAGDGSLRNKRTWAQLPEGAVPDGICLDAEGGIWSASPLSKECVRQLEHGEVTHRIELDRSAIACTIGAGKLYVLTAASLEPDQCRASRDGRVEVYAAPYAAAGHP